jgi:hypothetical protein
MTYAAVGDDANASITGTKRFKASEAPLAA